MKNKYWSLADRIVLGIFTVAVVAGVGLILAALLQGLNNVDWGA